MITPGLEQLIGKGIAQYKTFTYGVGGVGRIPVPKGSFIIITDFDYFHFIDTPTESLPATPAVSQFGWDTTEQITDITWQLNGIPIITPLITFDASDPLQAQSDFQAYITANFPGFTVSVALITVGLVNSWTVTVTTTTPGTVYNGLVPVVTFNPAPTGLSFTTPFIGGSDGAVTPADIIANSAHQLEFRSVKSSNHFIIREKFNIERVLVFDFETQNVTNETYWNVNGYYHKDTYLVHTSAVQIDVIRIPPPDTWDPSTYSILDQKSQEADPPRGYGQAPNPLAQPTMRQAVFSAGERYDPLTPEFENLVGSAQDQLKFNVIAGRQLIDPTGPMVGTSNGKNYPVVNIGYVLINKDYSEYVKSS